MWYLLNEYYLCLHFEPGFYRLDFPPENIYFQKFWFEILKNDAHNGDWKKYSITEHPRFGHEITTWSMISIQKRKSEQKVSFTHQKFIGSLIQMTPFTYTWTPLGHVVGMLLQRQSPLIWEPYSKQDQALHKLANNNGRLKSTLGKCPIQSK